MIVGDPGTAERKRAERRILAAGAALVIAVAAAYANSLSAPFVFLDVPAIGDNATIRHLLPLWHVLNPPSAGGVTVGGRPLVNLSLALNYAISGTHPWSYHAVNVLIHAFTGLALFGVVRRTLERMIASSPERPWADPGAFAFAVALLWSLHPLQTESVTYVIQRAESLMGLLYLLTLYCFIRYAECEHAFARRSSLSESEGGEGGAGRKATRRVWAVLSVSSCLLGMATKEVMVSAPLIVLLYDRTFVSGTLRSAWARHGRMHAALFASWILLAVLVAGTGGNRGGTSGFGLGLPWWQYALTQFPAIARYLRLSLLPLGQDLFYPIRWIHSAAAVAPAMCLVCALAAVSVAGLLRRTWWGLAGFWFFAILAPTSLVPGITQTVAEHRMYLALAPVTIVAAAALSRLFGLLTAGAGSLWTSRVAAASPLLLVILAALLGVATARRNRVYASEVVLWGDTAAKSVDSPYVQNNFGVALAAAGRSSEAAQRFENAVALAPDYAEAHNNLALALAEGGRLPEAIAEYGRAIGLRPDYAEAEANLGVALSASGRQAEALDHFRRAVQLAPGYAEAHNNLAAALAQGGRLDEAIAEYQTVLRLMPGRAEVSYNLGNALLAAGRTADAIAQFREAVRLKPDYVEALSNLGAMLAQSGRPAEAIERYERALEIAPGDADIHYNLGLALRAAGRGPEAERQFEAAARLRRGAGSIQ
jgi:Flp pilus assembly protein TadD